MIATGRTSLRGRRAWTIDEWDAFARRCRGVLDALEGLIRKIPRTPGIDATIVRAFVNAHMKFTYSMIGLETPIVRQVPGLEASVLPFVHGTQWVQRLGSVPRPTGRGEPRELTRDEWMAFGTTLRAVRDGIARLGHDLGRNKEAGRLAGRNFLASAKTLGNVRVKLDAIVAEQHPEWAEFASVFYGANLPDPVPSWLASAVQLDA